MYEFILKVCINIYIVKMFILCVTSLLFLPLLLRGSKYNTPIRILQVTAVANVHDQIQDCNNSNKSIDFYILKYSMGKNQYKVCTYETTIPVSLYTPVPKRFLTRAVAVTDRGDIVDVTACLRAYAGIDSSFSANQISLYKILAYEAVSSVHAVICYSERMYCIGICPFFRDRRVHIHINGSVVSV